MFAPFGMNVCICFVFVFVCECECIHYLVFVPSVWNAVCVLCDLLIKATIIKKGNTKRISNTRWVNQPVSQPTESNIQSLCHGVYEHQFSWCHQEWNLSIFAGWFRCFVFTSFWTASTSIISNTKYWIWFINYFVSLCYLSIYRLMTLLTHM